MLTGSGMGEVLKHRRDIDVKHVLFAGNNFVRIVEILALLIIIKRRSAAPVEAHGCRVTVSMNPEVQPKMHTMRWEEEWRTNL
jgi:hypothetical protein